MRRIIAATGEVAQGALQDGRGREANDFLINKRCHQILTSFLTLHAMLASNVGIKTDGKEDEGAGKLQGGGEQTSPQNIVFVS